MARKKNGNRGIALGTIPSKTKRAIASILLIVVGAFMALAAFGAAGIAGSDAYRLFAYLLGYGYFTVPLLFFMLGGAALREESSGFTPLKIAASLLFLIAGLGFVDIASGHGGLLGHAIAAPAVRLFDLYAALLLLGGLALAALLIVLEGHIAAEHFSFIRKIGAWVWSLLKRKEGAEPRVSGMPEDAHEDEEELADEEDEEEVEEEESMIARPLPARAGGGGIPMRIQLGEYSPPPLSLLDRDRGKPGVGDIKANANIIKRTLQNFGIHVELDEISIGPSVTRYAIKPAEGVRLSKIVSLQTNLELALAAHPVRIEAPIPGKSLVGVEVPNATKSIVGLGTMLSSPDFSGSHKALMVALGRDIAGASHFANLARMPHLLIAGATGSGKTCGKDTYIFSERGMLTFDELCPLPLNTEADYALRVATRDGIETTSKNYNNGVCNFYKLTTREGFSIEVTGEHPLWSIENGTAGWKSGEAVRVGEYVAISHGAKLFGSNGTIHFTPSPDRTNKSRVITLPTAMSKELGLFMGLLSADGGLTIKNRVVYTQANEEVLNLYLSLLRNLFGITAPAVEKSGHSNKAKDIIVHSKQLKEFLAYLGMHPVGAKLKEVPRAVRESSPETIRAYVHGLIRNDGHVSSVGLEITLASEILMRQLQLLLLNFGVVGSLRPKRVKGYEHNAYWRLAVYGEDFAAYAREIGFLTEEERGRAAGVLARERNTNKNIVPTLAPLLRKLSDAYRSAFARITQSGWAYRPGALIPKYAFNSLRSYNNGARSPSYGALQRVLAFYEPLAGTPEYKEIAELCASNFYWARIETIERTSGVGYDFEVPGSNSFVGNGFVNHNSVSIHALITSLIYRNSPGAMRFLMIDPKRVELTLYNRIPHLLSPVITEPKRAIAALRWAGKEMERRYNILETERVRDIESYHNNILSPALKKLKEGGGGAEAEAAMPEAMPYIVIIIDELADIMSTYPRELEAAVVRLAQMSRAVGIHLVLSTQRPSVNVITGLIKANIPARVALQVASQIDSRTILDSGGAEKLLGAGDMLYLSGDMGKPVRLQSAYIGEDEVKRVVDYLAKHNDAELPIDIGGNGSSVEGSLTSFNNDDEVDDDLYEAAREAVLEAGKASTSYLQRKLRVGYARAARLIDILEERGVIGPGDGAKPREIIGREGVAGEDPAE